MRMEKVSQTKIWVYPCYKVEKSSQRNPTFRETPQPRHCDKGGAGHPWQTQGEETEKVGAVRQTFYHILRLNQTEVGFEVGCQVGLLT